MAAQAEACRCSCVLADGAVFIIRSIAGPPLRRKRHTSAAAAAWLRSAATRAILAATVSFILLALL